MTPHEAAQVLAVLSAAWPKNDLPESTVVLWAGHMRDVRFDAGLEAAKLLTRTERFFPSYARFRETALAVRDPAYATAPLAIDRPEPTDVERLIARRAIDESREVLRRAGARNVRQPEPMEAP